MTPTAQHKRRGQSKRKKTGSELTKGQVNRIIDTLFHRHFSKNPGLIFFDGFAHFIVENNPRESLRKFVRYNVPALLREAVRKRRRRHV